LFEGPVVARRAPEQCNWAIRAELEVLRPWATPRERLGCPISVSA